MKKIIGKIAIIFVLLSSMALCFVGCGKSQPQITQRDTKNEINTQNFKKYTLDRDIFLKDNAFITIQEDTVLDLNGHAIVGNNSYVIQVGGINSKAHLVLQDSANPQDNTHYLAYSKYTNSYSRYGKTQQGGTDATAAPSFLPDSFIAVQGGLITGGSGSFSGGGVYVYEGSKFDMLSGTIAGNSTIGGGGAVYVSRHAMFSLRGGTIKGNSSTGYGGGVYVAEGKCNIYGGTIVGNTAVAGGGGVYTLSSEFNMTDGNVLQNFARFGGGINAIASQVTVFGGNVERNLAQEGGGMSLFNSNCEMQGGNIKQNMASKRGGGIKFAQTEGSATFNLYDGKIDNNMARQGGGIYLLRATVNLNGGQLLNNRASDKENSIYNLENSGSVVYNGCKIEE